MSRIASTLAFAVALLLADGVHAQWQVTRLAPDGAIDSFANAVRDDQVGGFVNLKDVGHAALWPGPTNSFVDLSSDNGQINGVDGGEQAGSVFLIDTAHASLWSGTPGSRIDLHPAGSEGSVAKALHGNTQAGYATFDNGVTHASIWHGTADSWVDLHPAGAIGSEVSGTDGSQHVGFAARNSQEEFRAALWNGTNDWIDLNPVGATGSGANATENGRQAGFARFDGATHAGMWQGSAASWFDMHPVGPVQSGLTGISENWQSGWVQYDPIFYRAGVWGGSAASFEDLHAALPGIWTTSFASGIWSDGTTLWVSGWGQMSGNPYREALLWSRPVPEPSGLVLAGLGVAALLPLCARGNGRCRARSEVAFLQVAALL